MNNALRTWFSPDASPARHQHRQAGIEDKLSCTEQAMDRKGVCYDTGRMVDGRSGLPEFNPAETRRELAP
jgi:hypothetical protein